MFFIAAVFPAFSPVCALAYKKQSHESFTDVSVKISKKYKGFVENFGRGFNSSKYLTERGSFLEDDFPRFVNHFLDPINGRGLGGGFPSISWGEKNALNSYSWHEARSQMYKGLTGESLFDQDENIRKMFRSLGHVIHLVQDKAQPSHVRGDPHSSHFEPFGGVLAPIINPSILEEWVLFHDSEVIVIANSVLEPNTVYSFEHPFLTLSSIVNRNFFSDDTIFRDYPQPSMDETNYSVNFFGIGTVVPVEAEDGQIDQVSYIVKTRGAFTGTKLAQIGYFGTVVALFPQLHSLAFHIDDEVAKENAAILIPLAVSYSAGLLDYFFRGELEVKEAELDADRMKISVKVINRTVGEEAGPGSLTLVAHYQIKGEDKTIVSNAYSVGGNLPRSGEVDPYQFTFAEEIPSDANNLKYTMVFRGLLGAEADAVIGENFTSEALNYVLIVQERATLNGESVEKSLDYDYREYNSRDTKSGSEWSWSRGNQVLSGRFVPYGEIKKIQLSYTYTCDPMTCTILGPDPLLFINNDLMSDGNWMPGDTGSPPEIWRVEGMLMAEKSNFVRPVILSKNMELSVTMADGSKFILRPFFYTVVTKWGYKLMTWGPGWRKGRIFTSSGAGLLIRFGSLKTPDYELVDDEMFDIVEIGGLAPINEGTVRYDEGTYLSKYGEYTFKYKHTLRDLAIVYYRSFQGGYYQELSTFTCPGINCKDTLNDFVKGIEGVYNSLTTPQPKELKIQGTFRRKYSEEELQVLEEKGIPPEEYDLILD